MAKYDALARYLERAPSPVALRFGELDEMLGGLPRSAKSNRTWWGNSLRSNHASVWLKAGWKVASVSFQEETVVFERGPHEPRGPQPSGGATRTAAIQNGRRLLERFVEAAGYPNVESAAAAHTVFLHPDTVAQTNGRAVFPAVRDPGRRGTFGELEGFGPVLYDDNTTPTAAFLWAAQRAKGPDVQFNHVWNTSGDPRSYTALWNLCCTPAFLAKTTDTHRATQALLRYRSWDLFGHVPSGEVVPVEPHGYRDLKWPDPPPSVDDLEFVLRKTIATKNEHRATVAARTIGWLYSSGPDTGV